MNRATKEEARASVLDRLFLIGLPFFLLGCAVTFAATWYGLIATRNLVIAEQQADLMRMATQLDRAYQDSHRIGVLAEPTRYSLQEGELIVFMEQSSGCQYFGVVEKDATGSDLVAVIEREQCARLSREVRLMVQLGSEYGGPWRAGDEYVIYRLEPAVSALPGGG